ncbi:Hypothetical protein Nlim_0501 [Candidatus Nitrosarchaeum limnium SFB1]|jgi:hypothetical protein|uniref:Uncharacterized protein n=1 Tax=Candidatus Nitrosarchaeum limnium SFB1 TaxID=886738 RepID=F3KJ46_9ARCH|nr:Hypothetical protein Nlim_0501 [Candidatus Nitrosarchaeum limnium SFB1]
MIRIQYNSMYKICIELGTCVVTKPNRSISCWAVLNHYGISQDDLKKLNLSYDELYVIYKTVQQHEQIREFLKNLKKRVTLITED